MSELKIENKLAPEKSYFNDIKPGEIFIGNMGLVYVKLPDSDITNNHAFCLTEARFCVFGPMATFKVPKNPRLIIE